MILACGPGANQGASQASDPTEPPAACDPGTMPTVAGACAPVGPEACPDGFARSSSGWGCEAVVPAEACSGATRAALGEAACIALDDCSAPLPAGATVVKDSASLAAAILSARRGATIALEAGEYGPVTIRQDVNLVGRCAERVVVRGGGDRGVWIQGEVNVSLRSMTVTGFTGGLAVSYGPTVTASHLVLSNNQIAVAAGEATVKLSESVVQGPAPTKDAAADSTAFVASIAGKLTVEDVDVRDASSLAGVYDEGTTLTMKRSVATYAGPAKKGADYVQVFRGGAFVADGSTLRNRASVMLYIGNDLPGVPASGPQRGGSARFVSSEVAQRGFSRSDDALVLVAAGGTLELEGTTLVHESGQAILLGEGGASAKLAHSVLRAVPNGDEMRGGLMAIHGASAELTSTAVVAASQNGLLVAGPGGTLTLDHSLVSGTRYGGAGPSQKLGGVGMAVGAAHEATLTITDSAIVDTDQFSVMASDGAHVQMSTSVVDGTTLTDQPIGGIAVTIEAGAELAMDACVVRGSQDAALAFIDGRGLVENSRFLGNAVGVHLQGTSLVEAKDAPREAGDTELVLFGDRFEGTGTFTRTSPIDMPNWAGN